MQRVQKGILIILPGVDQRRIASEAAKGSDLWRTLKEGGEDKDQENCVSFVVIPIWSFFWGLLLSFSEKVDMWMKDGSEEEPMIGISSSLLPTRWTLRRKGQWDKGKQKQEADIASSAYSIL